MTLLCKTKVSQADVLQVVGLLHLLLFNSQLIVYMKELRSLEINNCRSCETLMALYFTRLKCGQQTILVLQSTAQTAGKDFKLFTFLLQHKCPIANYHEILPRN